MIVNEVITSPAVVTVLTFWVSKHPCFVEEARVAAAVMLSGACADR